MCAECIHTNPQAVTWCALRVSSISSTVTSASWVGEPALDIVPEHLGVSKSQVLIAGSENKARSSLMRVSVRVEPPVAIEYSASMRRQRRFPRSGDKSRKFHGFSPPATVPRSGGPGVQGAQPNGCSGSRPPCARCRIASASIPRCNPFLMGTINRTGKPVRFDIERREPRCRICRHESGRIQVNKLLDWQEWPSF